MKYKFKIMKNLLNLLIVVIFLFVGISCKKTEIDNSKNPIAIIKDSVELAKDVLVNNDLSLLNNRITPINDSAYTFVDTNGDSKGGITPKILGSSSITIQVIAQLSSPKFNQEVLQASHIRIVNGYAYIVYNTQGARYLGGVDIVNISTAINPQLISNIIFNGKDVSSIDIEPKGSGNNNFVWITGAEENNPDLTTPAIVERYILNSSNQFKAINDPKQFYDLKGYVGTDVKFRNNKIYVTSGTGGGLTVLNNGMNLINYYPLDNARSVDANSMYVIALGGNPGHLFNPDVWNKLIGGATDPEAKSIVRLYTNSAAKCNYNFALAALGEAGLKCFNLASTTVEIAVSLLPRPTVPNGGNAWDYVTNGVSISNNWVYIANGAGGLDIAKLNTTTGQLTWIGNINLGSSANFVEASSNYVFVATGLGGLKILKVIEN
jgi:hypothetical protein